MVTCTSGASPVTTVRVTSRLSRKATFEVSLSREAASAAVVEASTLEVTLDARESRSVDVPLKDPVRAADVRTCRIGDVRLTSGSAPAASSPPTGGSGSTGGGSSGGSTGGSTSKPLPKPAKTR
ncbi:hypothetical protein AMK16_24360 [Streptomyces sp. CB00455]|uniref:hypothetical protein n=1 Tax=Streptomyces sp. CB00455 TaxID=1703927 RepID=UPI0009398F20|nr:hypothetical protein [Streptomyces sp. CB00455]OKK16829.1 hypothetical protein AMK16_24360 [Streptomyces sp. CB00455]